MLLGQITAFDQIVVVTRRKKRQPRTRFLRGAEAAAYIQAHRKAEVEYRPEFSGYCAACGNDSVIVKDPR